MTLDDVVKEGDAMREVAKTFGAAMWDEASDKAEWAAWQNYLGQYMRRHVKRPGRHAIKPRPVWFNDKA